MPTPSSPLLASILEEVPVLNITWCFTGPIPQLYTTSCTGRLEDNASGAWIWSQGLCHVSEKRSRWVMKRGEQGITFCSCVDWIMLVPAHPDVLSDARVRQILWVALFSEVSSCPWQCPQPYLRAGGSHRRMSNFSKDQSNDLVEEADARCDAGEATSCTWRARPRSCWLWWRAGEVLSAVLFPSVRVQPPKRAVYWNSQRMRTCLRRPLQWRKAPSYDQGCLSNASMLQRERAVTFLFACIYYFLKSNWNELQRQWLHRLVLLILQFWNEFSFVAPAQVLLIGSLWIMLRICGCVQVTKFLCLLTSCHLSLTTWPQRAQIVYFHS